MQNRITTIHHPANARELLALLGKGRGRVAPVGGGVSFSFSVPSGVSELASMRALGLDGVALDRRGLCIGALVTIAALASSAKARRFLGGVLADAASKVAATPNRNLITVGGNAVRLFIWSDLPAVWCATGAVFTVRGPRAARRVPAERFYASPPQALIGRGYLETVTVPAPSPRTGAAYEKFCETENTFALVSAAACVTRDKAGRCLAARLALGGLQLLPRVSAKAAALLRGRVPEEGLLAEAAAAAVEEAKTVRDMRVTAGYKRELAAVVARRALERAFAAAAREGGGRRR